MKLPLTGRRQPLPMPADLVVTSSLTIPNRADPRVDAQDVVTSTASARRRCQRLEFTGLWSLTLALRLRRFAESGGRVRESAWAVDAWTPIGPCDRVSAVA